MNSAVGIGGLRGIIGADDLMTYTPCHNVVEKVVSLVCRCDRCRQSLAYSITFSESLCDHYWDVKPCKKHLTIFPIMSVLFIFKNSID